MKKTIPYLLLFVMILGTVFPIGPCTRRNARWTRLGGRIPYTGRRLDSGFCRPIKKTGYKWIEGRQRPRRAVDSRLLETHRAGVEEQGLGARPRQRAWGPGAGALEAKVQRNEKNLGTGALQPQGAMDTRPLAIGSNFRKS